MNSKIFKISVLFFSIFIKTFAQGPIIIGLPFESNMLQDEVTINWKTNVNSTGVVKFGLTTQLNDSVVELNSSIAHATKIINLKSSTAYYYQVGASDANGTRYSPVQIFSTSSPNSSSGAMYVYFSKFVNPSVSIGEIGTVANLSEKFIDKINNAQYSIDAMFYSLSGTVGNNIATALVNAKNRGVKVRVIMESENATSTAVSTLKINGVPFIDDKFDPLNNGVGLMHNKIGIFDFREKSMADDDWVTVGSWNATDPGTNNDAQNVVHIQDQSLANTYTIEFEEMWGSNTETPNANNSRFGPRKINNTPHRFIINGIPVESYFSPSDGTSSQIISQIQKATSSVYCALLSFTRDDISLALVNKFNDGKAVRILMDNSSDTGNEFNTLKNAGVDVLLKKNLSGLLHHKYAIINSDKPSETNVVITGSHNWSSSAENSNGENTIIIQSKRIANLFLQEFKARYIDAGGAAQITKINSDNNFIDNEIKIINYPNPFNNSCMINFNILQKEKIKIKIYDYTGKEISTLLNEELDKGNYSIKFIGKNLPSGIYFYRFEYSSKSIFGKMQLIK